MHLLTRRCLRFDGIRSRYSKPNYARLLCRYDTGLASRDHIALSAIYDILFNCCVRTDQRWNGLFYIISQLDTCPKNHTIYREKLYLIMLQFLNRTYLGQSQSGIIVQKWPCDHFRQASWLWSVAFDIQPFLHQHDGSGTTCCLVVLNRSGLKAEDMPSVFLGLSRYHDWLPKEVLGCAIWENVYHFCTEVACVKADAFCRNERPFDLPPPGWQSTRTL